MTEGRIIKDTHGAEEKEILNQFRKRLLRPSHYGRSQVFSRIPLEKF